MLTPAGSERVPFIVGSGKVFELVPSFFVLEFLERFGLDLTDSLSCYAHHIADLFESKWAEIAGDPGAIEKSFGFETPFAGDIGADFLNQTTFFLTNVGINHAHDPFG